MSVVFRHVRPDQPDHLTGATWRSAPSTADNAAEAHGEVAHDERCDRPRCGAPQSAPVERISARSDGRRRGRRARSGAARAAILSRR